MSIWQLAVLVGALALGNLAYADDPAGELQQLVDKASAHRVLLVGEVHGTSETPARVAELAAAMASEERPLIVGVEIWRTEQERIDRFIASAGTAEDRQQLLDGPFWQRSYQDGRSSVAMADLLQSLRALALKAPVRVLAFDLDPKDKPGTDAERDAQMAEALRTVLNQQPEVRALVLAGNFHTRIQEGAPWDPDHRFMGFLLSEFRPYSIEIMGVSGSSWTCTGRTTDTCMARDMPANELQAGLQLGDEINARGHLGHWWLAQVSASPPARDPRP
ncbi:MAG: ChaN family lipoprotein [Rhodanobacteraceae bacterium]|nr:ChaN family lipoprotein [Rhodanobacteraceae bacterium]